MILEDSGFVTQGSIGLRNSLWSPRDGTPLGNMRWVRDSTSVLLREDPTVGKPHQDTGSIPPTQR